MSDNSTARNTPSRGRFVWITEEEITELIHALIAQKWWEAPADPVEAIRTAIYAKDGWEYQVVAVLRALGGFPLETT